MLDLHVVAATTISVGREQSEEHKSLEHLLYGTGRLLCGPKTVSRLLLEEGLAATSEDPGGRQDASRLPEEGLDDICVFPGPTVEQ